MHILLTITSGLLKPAKASKVVITCAALHNLANDINMPDVHDEYKVPQQPEKQFEGREEGRAVRDHIARHYFM